MLIGDHDSDDALGLAVYADLGSGELYGTIIVSASSNGQIVNVILNGPGVAAVEAARSSPADHRIAFGGQLGDPPILGNAAWLPMLASGR